MEGHLVTLFVHIGTPVSIRISCQLTHDEMPKETLHIQFRPVSYGIILEVRGPQSTLHKVESPFDISRLLSDNLIITGRLDGHRDAMCTGKP